MIPFYRRREFAHLKPATKTRFELAFALVDVPFKGRLKKNPRANDKDRHQHLIELTDVKDVDAEVVKWRAWRTKPMRLQHPSQLCRFGDAADGQRERRRP